MAFRDFSAHEVPNWAVEPTCDASELEDIQGSIEMSAFALSLNPEGYRYWLDRQLAGLHAALIEAYYDVRAGEPPEREVEDGVED